MTVASVCEIDLEIASCTRNLIYVIVIKMPHVVMINKASLVARRCSSSRLPARRLPFIIILEVCFRHSIRRYGLTFSPLLIIVDRRYYLRATVCVTLGLPLNRLY